MCWRINRPKRRTHINMGSLQAQGPPRRKRTAVAAAPSFAHHGSRLAPSPRDPLTGYRLVRTSTQPRWSNGSWVCSPAAPLLSGRGPRLGSRRSPTPLPPCIGQPCGRVRGWGVSGAARCTTRQQLAVQHTHGSPFAAARVPSASSVAPGRPCVWIAAPPRAVPMLGLGRSRTGWPGAWELRMYGGRAAAQLLRGRMPRLRTRVV